MTRKGFENGAAWLGFAGVVLGAILLALTALRMLDRDWSVPLSLALVVAGSCAFYGFGCFLIWPGDDPQPDQRSTIWFVHQYWVNACGALGGWASLFFLGRRYLDGELTLSAGEFLLGAVAFLGLIGHLPLMITGIAFGIRDVAKKVLDKIV